MNPGPGPVPAMLDNAPPPATRDSLPADLALRRRLERLFSSNAQSYGFEEIATPMYERADLFAARSGPEIKSSLLTFHCDHEEYALRPEMTAPVCRLAASGALADLPRPHKLFYVAPCFRYCRPHSGRSREFTQAGIEALGDPSPSADAEVIAATHRFLRRIGIDGPALKVGTAGIFRALLPERLSPDDRAAVIGHLDRLAGIGERSVMFLDTQDPLLAERLRGDRRELASLQIRSGYEGEFAVGDRPFLDPEPMARGLPDEAAATYKHLWGVEGYVPEDVAELMIRASAIRGTLDEVSALASETLDGTRAERPLRDLMDVCGRLDHYGIGGFEVALGIARGLTFYTGTVFEITSGRTKLSGGGRYDRLVELFGGESTPATGCAVRLDTLQGIVGAGAGSLGPEGIALRPASPADESDAVRLAEALRDRGTPVGQAGAVEARVESGMVLFPAGAAVEADAEAVLAALAGERPGRSAARESA